MNNAKNQILAFILGMASVLSANIVAQSISTLSADIIIANTSIKAPTITATSAIGSPAIAATGTNTFIGSVASTGVSGTNNTIIGQSAGSGITTGSGNTILGAQVTGLAAGLTNNIILANGTGAIKAQHDGASWNLLTATGAPSFTGTGGALPSAATTQSQIWVNGTLPTLSLTRSANTADSRNHIFAGNANGTNFQLNGQFINDAYNAVSTWLQVIGSSAAIASIGLTGNTTITGTAAVTSGGAANAAVCWKADAITLGHCTSVVAAGGTCTCA